MASQEKILRGALFRLIQIIKAYEPDKALWTVRLMSEVIQSDVLINLLYRKGIIPRRNFWGR
jgi:hypothetical protein